MVRNYLATNPELSRLYNRPRDLQMRTLGALEYEVKHRHGRREVAPRTAAHTPMAHRHTRPCAEGTPGERDR